MIPAHLEEPRIFRGRRGLVGALALDRDQDAGLHVTRHTAGQGGDGLGRAGAQGNGHITLGIGRPLIVHDEERGAGAKARAVHHEVISRRGVEPGRETEDERGTGPRGGITDLAEGADVKTVGQARVAHGRGGARARILRREGRGIRDGHGDLLVEMLLHETGGSDRLVGEHVLPNNLGRHHHDCGDGSEQQPGHREGREDFDQREATGAAGPAEKAGRGKIHRTERATI